MVKNIIIGQDGAVAAHERLGGILVSDEYSEGDWIPTVLDNPTAVTEVLNILPEGNYSVHVLPMRSFFSRKETTYYQGVRYLQDMERNVIIPAGFIRHLHELYGVQDVTVYLKRDFPLFFKVSQAFFTQFIAELDEVSLSFDFL